MTTGLPIVSDSKEKSHKAGFSEAVAMIGMDKLGEQYSMLFEQTQARDGLRFPGTARKGTEERRVLHLQQWKVRGN